MWPVTCTLAPPLLHWLLLMQLWTGRQLPSPWQIPLVKLLSPATVGTSPTIWDPQYQAPICHIKPRPTISGPHTKQWFQSCSMHFSPHSVSKIHEWHFDQENGSELFVPSLSVLSICQGSSKIVKQCQSPLPLWQSYCWSRWILSNLRGSTVLCFKASKNKSFAN